MAETDKKNETLWGILCHLSSVCAFLGIPFANIIAPLAIWLMKKKELPLVDQEGKSSLNFQISMTIYTLFAMIFKVIGIGFLLVVPLILVNLILVIIASIKTSHGEKFEYPLSIKFIK